MKGRVWSLNIDVDLPLVLSGDVIRAALHTPASGTHAVHQVFLYRIIIVVIGVLLYSGMGVHKGGRIV